MFCKKCPTEERKRTEVLASSVVVLPASPIGLSGKAGMMGRDWNRKTERKTEREFLWLGTQHRKRRGLSCVYSGCVQRSEKQVLSKE